MWISRILASLEIQSTPQQHPIVSLHELDRDEVAASSTLPVATKLESIRVGSDSNEPNSQGHQVLVGDETVWW